MRQLGTVGACAPRALVTCSRPRAVQADEESGAGPRVQCLRRAPVQRLHRVRHTAGRRRHAPITAPARLARLGARRDDAVHGHRQPLHVLAEAAWRTRVSARAVAGRATVGASPGSRASGAVCCFFCSGVGTSNEFQVKMVETASAMWAVCALRPPPPFPAASPTSIGPAAPLAS